MQKIMKWKIAIIKKELIEYIVPNKFVDEFKIDILS